MNWEAIGAIGEVVGAVAVVLSLLYVGLQVRMSNRLAKAEASRVPNSDLNNLNATFGTNPILLGAFRKALLGASRTEVDEEERLILDLYLISLTNLQEQLTREMRAGIVDESALDFQAAGVFLLPYYRTSWSLYRAYMSKSFVQDFEKSYDLDPTVAAEW